MAAVFSLLDKQIADQISEELTQHANDASTYATQRRARESMYDDFHAEYCDAIAQSFRLLADAVDNGLLERLAAGGTS